MFGIIGVWIVAIFITISGLISMYKAGKFSSGYIETNKGKSAVVGEVGAFIIDVILVVLLIL